MNTFTIFSVVIGIISIVIHIIFIYLLTKSEKERIKNSNCPTIYGNFAVIPSKSSTGIKSECPQNANSLCTFNDIQSISEAVQKCNTMAGICKRFTYNTTSKIMSIVSDSVPLIDSNSDNIFIRQA